MHDVWWVPRLAWLAIIFAYLVLAVIPGRVHVWEKRFNDALFVAVVVFGGIRVFARYVLYSGPIFRYGLVLASLAATIGIPLRIKALIVRIATSSEMRAAEVRLKADS